MGGCYRTSEQTPDAFMVIIKTKLEEKLSYVTSSARLFLFFTLRPYTMFIGKFAIVV